ncbi:hypothetical protein RhiirB3_455074 [Rhizophagus irregularis]|nr:hypothetical protein RhiirB3_455074 [Rhizophagus irregularis]
MAKNNIFTISLIFFSLKKSFPLCKITCILTPSQSNFTPPSGSDEVSIIGSILPDDIALSTPPQSNFTPPSDSDEVKVPLQIGSILPDGTVLPKPPPQLNFIPARDSDEVSFSSSQMTFDDDGNFVKEIYFVNISQCAEVLKKKKTLSPVERSTLRYAVLTVPALVEEVNAFIADVEKVRLRLCQL